MSSRLRKFEEQRLKRRLFLSIVGSIGILLFLGLFGLKILESFSLFIDTLHGATPQSKDISSSLLLPPTLNALPEATNSASLTITGIAKPDTTLILYVNEKESGKTTVGKDGTFSTVISQTQDGKNTVSAKITDNKGNFSGLSNVLSVMIKKTKPKLEVSSPTDNAKVNTDTINVTGTTEDDTTVRINDHFALINNDRSFSYKYKLNDGDNTLKIVAVDLAGNETSIERHVTLQK